MKNKIEKCTPYNNRRVVKVRLAPQNKIYDRYYWYDGKFHARRKI